MIYETFESEKKYPFYGIAFSPYNPNSFESNKIDIANNLTAIDDALKLVQNIAPRIRIYNNKLLNSILFNIQKNILYYEIA